MLQKRLHRFISLHAAYRLHQANTDRIVDLQLSLNSIEREDTCHYLKNVTHGFELMFFSTAQCSFTSKGKKKLHVNIKLYSHAENDSANMHSRQNFYHV